MRSLAIISDVHADALALHDALQRIDEMGCDGVVCAGDVVDYGRFPERTIALLRERHVSCIRGNHDRWALLAEAQDAPGLRLTRRAMEFLAGLPTRWNATIEGVRVSVRHGTPRSDMIGIDPQASGEDARRWLAEAGADVLVVGHTHVPFALQVGAGLIVNPGALLRDPDQPDEDALSLAPLAGGTFGVLELPAQTFRAYSAVDGSEVDILRVKASPVRGGRR